MRLTSITAFAVAMAIGQVSYGEGASPRPNTHAKSVADNTIRAMNTLKIRITVNGNTIFAALDDNPTARDFYSLLPLTLTLDDYAATEKVSYLPRKLSKDGAPAGIDPAIGDIAYYAPWGNMAIYYRDFGYSTGLIKLGVIESGLEAFMVPGSLSIRIEQFGNEPS